MPLARLTDAQLMRRVTDHRDDAAFEVLYNRHSTLAMSCALRLVFDHGLAADAVQAAFLDVWRRSADYSPARGQVGPWIAAIATNRAIDILRRTRTQERAQHAASVAAREPQEIDLACDALIERESGERWRTGVDALPVAQRDVIRMAYYDDLTHIEIASRLSVPLGTVKGRARLGLARLRGQLSGDPAGLT